MRPATVLRPTPTPTPYNFADLPRLTHEEAALWNFYCRYGPAAQDWNSWASELFGHLFEHRAGLEVRLAQTHLVDTKAAEKTLTFGSKQAIIVGRETGSDVTLSANAIADRHAQLSIRDGRAYLQDLGTRLGTYLWGKRLSANESYPLASGDQFTIFPYCFRVLLEDRWDA